MRVRLVLGLKGAVLVIIIINTLNELVQGKGRKPMHSL